MKKLFALVCILLSCLCAGCLTDSGGGDSSSPGTHAYYPLKEGAYWQYTKTYDITDIPGYGIHTTRTEIGKSVVVNHKPYWICRNRTWTSTNERESSTYLRSANNILYSLYRYDSTEVCIFKLDANTGDKWEISSDTSSDKISQTGTYIGTEDVSVPAGVFRNCKKYMTESVRDNYFRGSLIDSDKTVIYTWLAEGIGIVKYDSYYYPRSPSNLDTIQKSQLTEYFIP